MSMTPKDPTLPRVVLHVGAPKSGTTFLQRALWRNRAALAGAGYLLPGASAREMFLAAIEVRETHETWGFQRAELAGTWQRLRAEARGSAGTTIMSHELLAAATDEQIAAALEELGRHGRPRRLHRPRPRPPGGLGVAGADQERQRLRRSTSSSAGSPSASATETSAASSGATRTCPGCSSAGLGTCRPATCTSSWPRRRARTQRAVATVRRRGRLRRRRARPQLAGRRGEPDPGSRVDRHPAAGERGPPGPDRPADVRQGREAVSRPGPAHAAQLAAAGLPAGPPGGAPPAHGGVDPRDRRARIRRARRPRRAVADSRGRTRAPDDVDLRDQATVSAAVIADLLVEVAELRGRVRRLSRQADVRPARTAGLPRRLRRRARGLVHALVHR